MGKLCVMYSTLRPCYEFYSERQKTRAAEMACYLNDLGFDRDKCVGGKRGYMGSVFSEDMRLCPQLSLP